MPFYNINNEEVSQESILDDLIGYYQGLTDNGKSKIDDFHEGSEVRNLLEVLSHLAYNILEEQNNTLSNHFINTAEGEYLDLLGSNPNVNLPRIQGTTATGLVKFSIPVEAVEEMIIPADTSVSTQDIEYVTLEDAYIHIGDVYTYVHVECTIEGKDGNCPVGAINTCELSDYIVTNDEAFLNGSDLEDDEDYRTRLLEYVREDNFGSIGWYENQILSIEGVHDIKRIGVTGVNYYVNTNDLNTQSTVYNELLAFFSDNNNKVVGHDIDMYNSELASIVFTITVNEDCGYTEEDIQDFFSCYFKGGDLQNYPVSFEGLNMKESVTKAGLQTLIKDYFVDITSATISNISSDGSTVSDFPSRGNHDAYNLDSVVVVFE